MHFTTAFFFPSPVACCFIHLPSGLVHIMIHQNDGPGFAVRLINLTSVVDRSTWSSDTSITGLFHIVVHQTVLSKEWSISLASPVGWFA